MTTKERKGQEQELRRKFSHALGQYRLKNMTHMDAVQHCIDAVQVVGYYGCDRVTLVSKNGAVELVFGGSEE